MSDLLKCFLTTILAAGVLVGSATWFLKRYLKRYIDNLFAEREKILESKLRHAEKYEEQMFHVSTQVLPEIHEVVHRSRNLVRKIIEFQDSRHVEPLIGYWNQLSDHLFKYQLFVPDETFDLILQYKRLLQNLALVLGASLQHVDEREGLSSSHISTLIISKEDLETLHAQVPAVDKLYREIVSGLRKMRCCPNKNPFERT